MLGRRADRQAVLALRVPGDAVAHFPREIQALAIVFEHVDDAQALFVVIEAAGHERAEHALAGMTKRRVAEVVAERDRFGQLFVQAQHLGDGARDLCDFERVREPRPVVIAGRREEDLRLVLQAAKRLGVDDAIAIALERGPDRIFGLGAQPALAVGALAAGRREFRARAARGSRGWSWAGRYASISHGSRLRANRLEKARAMRQRTDAERLRPASARDRRSCSGSRDRHPSVTRSPVRGAARARGNDRCSASSDRCRDRPVMTSRSSGRKPGSRRARRGRSARGCA